MGSKRPWKEVENQVCIQELPDFRKHMSNAKNRKMGKHGKKFANSMLDKYSILENRTDSALYQHMKYLNNLAFGEIETDRKKDKKYIGILLEGDEIVEDIVFSNKKEEKTNNNNDSKGTYNLSTEETAKLLAFVGYGDNNKSKIIFLGNEEGLGGYELQNVIQTNCEVFGNNPDCYLNPNYWKDGYYEIPENIEEQYKKVMKKLRGELREDTSLFAPMLEFQARIVLHFLQPDKEWFVKKGINKDNYNIIKNYYQKNLYNNNSQFNITLMDFRPFPRRNEKDQWPYSNLDKLQYLNAFKFNLKSKLKPFYKELRDTRAGILKRAIEQSHANLIVGIGDKDSKRRFFEQYFSNAQFEEYSLTKEKVELFKASIQLENRTITVLLSDFFNHYTIGLVGLEKLTKEHISPNFSESSS
ncbi:hypothetical protein [Solibacillus sp. FSL H8-0538]|uniref:hypothetical protein n=1 Tax=Solibacillus sp. FSL H8-0538 TaxID=2921400 RepID=UPI0030F7A6D3